MVHTHHSHSGQFCGHAKNTLEEVIQNAIEKKMEMIALTEHIPRDAEDLYPEEIEANVTPEHLVKLFDDYYKEAIRLREKYRDRINILIGFEGEWIRPRSHEIMNGLFDKYNFDLFVGSIHHTLTIPIDFGQSKYEEAREKAGGSDEKLFAAFFDEQYDMLQALKPPIVGHFDLIRLLSDNPERSFTQFPRVWEKMLRNLEFIASYGGMLELNSSALRKGMSEPYPKGEVCKEFSSLGGRFVLSDDSHGIDQIGLNFYRVLDFIRQVGIRRIHYLESGTQKGYDSRFRTINISELNISDLAGRPFFKPDR